MSILQRILNKVDGQVSEDFFRSQLIDELGSRDIKNEYGKLFVNLNYQNVDIKI